MIVFEATRSLLLSLESPLALRARLPHSARRCPLLVDLDPGPVLDVNVTSYLLPLYVLASLFGEHPDKALLVSVIVCRYKPAL